MLELQLKLTFSCVLLNLFYLFLLSYVILHFIGVLLQFVLVTGFTS